MAETGVAAVDRALSILAAFDGGSASLSLAELANRNGLRLLTDRIHFVDHWVTPVGENRRFDTRFFVTRAPEGQDPLHDDSETIASMWVRPADALERAQRGEVQMMPPTITSLQRLLPHADSDAAIAWAAAVQPPAPTTPKLVVDGDGRFEVLAEESDQRQLTTSSLVSGPRGAVSLSQRHLVVTADEETFDHAQLWKNLLRHTCTERVWSGERHSHHVTVWGNRSTTLGRMT